MRRSPGWRSLEALRAKCMASSVHAAPRPARKPVLYCPTMRAPRLDLPSGSRIATAMLAVGLVLWALAACSSKTLQDPEDPERFRRIDQAVDALREAYQREDGARLASLMLPIDSLEQLQRDAEADFEAFDGIALDFKIERILIEGDDIDVYVHWQGTWKKDRDDAGIRQRG